MTGLSTDPARTPRATQLGAEFKPLYVVWELTLACDLACRHCGSRAGKARPNELTRDEAIALVAQLAAAGTREITFIGGEAALYPAWLEVVAEARRLGIRPTLTTGGRRFGPGAAEAAAKAGMEAVSISVDGLEAVHDRLRAVPGSFLACQRAAEAVRAAGMDLHLNTQFNRLNLIEVAALGQLGLDLQATSWQVQLTGPMGRGADIPELLLQPPQVLELVKALVALAKAKLAPRIHAANNLGYFGRYEQYLRPAHFGGCVAGRYVLGIESDGSIKGCPSLPSSPYVAGNVRVQSFAELWNEHPHMRFARENRVEELWGYCGRCYYRSVCQGGCSWTAHTLLGRRGNNPWCAHRVEMLAEEGWEERLIQVETAPGDPFDFGRFEVVLQPLRAADLTGG